MTGRTFGSDLRNLFANSKESLSFSQASRMSFIKNLGFLVVGEGHRRLDASSDRGLVDFWRFHGCPQKILRGPAETCMFPDLAIGGPVAKVRCIEGETERGRPKRGKRRNSALFSIR